MDSIFTFNFYNLPQNVALQVVAIDLLYLTSVNELCDLVGIAGNIAICSRNTVQGHFIN